MKTLIVSTPFIPVPPPTYGGLERVVFDLAAALQRDDEVTVACPTDSRLPRNVRQLDIGPSRYNVQQNWIQAEKEAFERYKSALSSYDIVHDHTWWGWPYMAKIENNSLKIIHTHHGHLNWRTPPPVRHANLVGISRHMASAYSRLLGVPTRCVYNGVSLEFYPFNPHQGKRLIYLGRIVKFKQPHVAIDVARQAGIPVDIVGGDRFVDDFTYVDRVKNMCDGFHARYIGEVTHEIKLKYLRESRAVMIPSQMGEPFGLVAVEALACGRPVVCLDDGALGEIVEPSVGFVCQSAEEMLEVVRQGKDLLIKPEDCRKRAEQFSKERMAQKYRELYRAILEGNEW